MQKNTCLWIVLGLALLIPSCAKKAEPAPEKAPIPEVTVLDVKQLRTLEDQGIDATWSQEGIAENSHKLVAPPKHGSVELVNGGFRYLPESNYFGDDGFVYSAVNNAGTVLVSQVVLVVEPVNDLPIANFQKLVTGEDASLPIQLTGSDIENQQVACSSVTQPSHGALSGTAPNLTYTPASNFSGEDSFEFSCLDDEKGMGKNKIEIKIEPLNDLPGINGPTLIQTYEDTSASYYYSVSDVEGGSLALSIAALPKHGTLSQSGFRFTYSPTPDFYGNDSAWIQATDSEGGISKVLVTYVVSPVNDQPIAKGGAPKVSHGEPVTLTLEATDVDSDELDYNIVNPAHGTLVPGNARNQFIYTPNAGYLGTDIVSFTVTDGQLVSTESGVAVEVGETAFSFKALRFAKGPYNPIASMAQVSQDAVQILQPLESTTSLTGFADDPTRSSYYFINHHWLFGESGYGGKVNEIELSPEPSWPSAIAYDSLRDRVILISLGGEGEFRVYHPSLGTSETIASMNNLDLTAAVYDKARDRIIAYGGGYGSVGLYEFDSQGAVLRNLSRTKIPMDRECISQSAPFINGQLAMDRGYLFFIQSCFVASGAELLQIYAIDSESGAFARIRTFRDLVRVE